MSVTNIKSIAHQQAYLTFKITALNAETGEFKEKLLTLATGMPRDCLIGRHSSCDFVLDSAEVSRIHGRICFEDEQCFYTDFGSTGGSQIDEQQIKSDRLYPLKQNSLLRIGGFVLAIAQISNSDATRIQPSTEVAVTSPQPRYWNSSEITVRLGAGGACKLPLLAGEVNYDDEPVCEPGHLLSCIAKANGRVVIEA